MSVESVMIKNCSYWAASNNYRFLKKTHKCLLTAQSNEIAGPQGIFVAIFCTPDKNSCYLEQMYHLIDDHL